MIEFTIAIPVYNGENSLKKAIESAINQDYDSEYEILVSDNGSSDGTAAILETFYDRVRIIKRADTVPMYENHNICLREAKGKYIIICHADDILLSNALSQYHKALANRGFPVRYVLWGRSMFRDFYSNWKLADTHLNNILAGEKAIYPFLQGGLAPSGVCYGREELLRIGGFCSANLRLTPFDMTTMLKMAIYGFEFEMSDRLFFIRRFASTAHTITYKDLDESISDALACLRKEISADDFNYLVRLIKNSGLYFPHILRYLIKHQLMHKSSARKIALKRLIRKPHLIFNSSFLKEIAFFI